MNMQMYQNVRRTYSDVASTNSLVWGSLRLAPINGCGMSFNLPTVPHASANFRKLPHISASFRKHLHDSAASVRTDAGKKVHLWASTRKLGNWTQKLVVTVASVIFIYIKVHAFNPFILWSIIEYCTLMSAQFFKCILRSIHLSNKEILLV